MTASPWLRAEVLARVHGGREVVSDASLEVRGGEWVSLMGPSGCGKTSLLLMLGLLDRPTRGRVLLTEVDAWARGAAERAHLRGERLGFVFQQSNLLDGLTVLENVAVPTWRTCRDRRRAEERATELLARFGLADRARDLAGSLSSGEAQRVAVARALANRPAVVLADEPTGSLDSASAERVLAALAEVRASGAALLVATHDPGVAARGDRTVRMLDGRVLAASAP